MKLSEREKLFLNCKSSIGADVWRKTTNSQIEISKEGSGVRNWWYNIHIFSYPLFIDKIYYQFLSLYERNCLWYMILYYMNIYIR